MVVGWEECKDEQEQTNIGARALSQIIDLTDWTKSAQEGGPNRIAPVKRRILSKLSETWRAAPQVVVFLQLHIVCQVLRNQSVHKNSTRDDHARTSNGTENGNTQVTCHVGVPSCGQRHRNVFIDLLLTCTITNTIINDSLASPPCASSPALFSFAHPPTPVLSVTLRLKPNPVEEDQWKGFIRPVHRPSPRGAVNIKSTTPTHPVDYRVNTLNFTCDGVNIRKNEGQHAS